MWAKQIFWIRLITASLTLGLAVNAVASITADSIFSGGPIVTVDERTAIAEAVAVKNGQIIYVGDIKGVQTFIGPSTEKVNLKGHTLLPGFIDAHSHPILSALMGQTVNVSGFQHSTATQVWASLKAAVATANKGDWVLAYGWDPAILNELRAPSLDELDQLAPENPLLIVTQTLHAAFANTLAFQAAGVSKATPDPSGGYFEKNQAGELTGTVIEVPAIAYFKQVMPKYPRGAYQYLLENQMQAYASAGYTTVVAPGLQALISEPIAAVRFATDYANTQVRMRTYPLAKDLEFESQKPLAYKPQEGSQYFKVLGVKVWVDGSPYAGGMAMEEPYLNTDLTRQALQIPVNSRGHLTYSDSELNALVQRYHKQGWQISAHVQGERAVDQFLNAVELAQENTLRVDHRHRMEHLALITEAQLKRALVLGVTPSFYIEHIRYYGAALKYSIVGPERAERFMPQAWAAEAGHKVSIHTDSPSSPLNVFRAMQTSHLRLAQPGQQVVGGKQALSIERVLRAVTIDAAWQIFEEKNLGSISLGKRADFTLLSDNPMTLPAEQWQELKVMATYINGQRVETAGFTWRKLKLITLAAWQKVFGE